jgi:hypothetical protein
MAATTTKILKNQVSASRAHSKRPFAGLEAFYKAGGGEGRAIIPLDFLGKATQLQVQTATLTKLS